MAKTFFDSTSKTSLVFDWLRKKAGRWRQSLFSQDCTISLGIARIAIVVSNLWALTLIDPIGRFYPDNPELLYNPLGILLFFDTPPTLEASNLVLNLAYFLGALALIGFCTRLSLVLFSIACWYLFSLVYAFIPMWCHEYNTNLIALFILVYTPCKWGSVDLLLKRSSGHPDVQAPIVSRSEQNAWAMALIQFFVVIVFFNAAYWKLYRGGWSFSWIASDNLRNQLLHRYHVMGQAVPSIAQWALENPNSLKLIACANLLAQVASIATPFLIRRPYLRAFLGAFFVLEILGLHFLMDLTFFHWLPLYAVFVDWDRLLAVCATGVRKVRAEMTRRLGGFCEIRKA